MAELFLGVVADDFTGASDAASMLSEAGVSTVLFNGVPDEVPALRDDVRAIVIATKTRTMPAEDAVQEMLDAFSWLRKLGATQLYFKYCATFDSTEKGNIGPVADAVLDSFDIPYTIIAPSLPVNGRTVKDGILYLNGLLLSESHMRNHPLTPMTESDVAKLMDAQSKYKSYKVSVEHITNWLGQSDHEASVVPSVDLDKGKHYLVVDYYEEEHGDLIAEAFGSLLFLTGGSGLCGALGRRYVKLHPEIKKSGDSETTVVSESDERTKALLLAGSCSKVTLTQIDIYKDKGNPGFFMDPGKLISGELTEEDIFQTIDKEDGDVLVYSSQKPEDIQKTQELGMEKVASHIEKAMGDLAERAVREGYTTIISAGGETSGAVTKALGYKSFYIGRSVAPGVPVMIPTDNTKLRIVLKSGGFGQPDFFERALDTARN